MLYSILVEDEGAGGCTRSRGGGSEPLLELETLTEASGPHPAESGTSKESGAKRWRKRQRVRRAKTLPTTFGGKL